MPNASLHPGLAHRRRGVPGARLVLTVTSCSSTLAACWLLWVSAAVLPARDPAHVGTWRWVAGTLLAFAALSFAAVRPGSRTRGGRLLLAVLGTAAAGAGAGAVVREVRVGASGGHFEGYLLLLAVLVAAHGAAALAVSLSHGPAQARPGA